MQKRFSKKLRKIVGVVGPPASGKTACAINLAEKCNGEVISADSRQVYRGLDIGTDKVTHKEMRDITHHLIDIADPGTAYTAADFLRDADAAIADIAARGKHPIVAGGTFFYSDVLLGNRALAEVPASARVRAEIEALPADTLYKKLTALDPVYAKQIDKHNPRRLVRALEIVAEKGAMPNVVPRARYDACIIGIDIPPALLQERINTRLDKTLARGLVEETETLLAQGIPESRLNEIGLEYKVVLAYLRGTHTYEEMRAILKQKIWQYAKRQRTWLSKMKNVHWISPGEEEKMGAIIQKFLP